MVLAQALGEYVAASVVVDAFTRTWYSFRQFLSDVEPTTWLIAGAALFLAGYAWTRFR